MRYPAKKPTRRLPVGGSHATIDADDAELVNGYRWIPGGTKNRYVASLNKVNGVLRTTYLHRLLMDAQPGEIVDHIDGNPLNNRRENLRLVSRSENAANRAFTQNATGFRNVFTYPKRKPFRAVVRCDGIVRRGRYRETAEQAARDADAMLRDLYPRGVRLNYPEGDELPIMRGTSRGG